MLKDLSVICKNRFLSAKPFAGITIAFFISGCNSMIWDGSRYNSRMQQAYSKLNTKEFSDALSYTNSIEETIEDDYIYSLDKGMLQHRSGLFNDSYLTFDSNYSKLINAAEYDFDPEGTYYSVTNHAQTRHLVYRYSYGLQFMSTKTKYHPAAFEMNRAASYQVLNALSLQDRNQSRVAVQRLADIQKMPKCFTKNFPFINNSFNDLLCMIFFKWDGDDSGSSSVAYKQAIKNVCSAQSIISEHSFYSSYLQKLESGLNIFDGAYERNLENDIKIHVKSKYGELTKREVLGTRVVTQEEFDAVKKNIVQHIEIVRKTLFQEYYRQLGELESFLLNNKGHLTSTNNTSGSNCDLWIVFESGNAPRLKVNNDTKIGYTFLEPYSKGLPPLSLQLEGVEKRESLPLLFADFDLHTQLDFLLCGISYYRSIVTETSNLESDLCWEINRYYTERSRLIKAMSESTSKAGREMYKEKYLKLINGEEKRRNGAYQKAQSKLKRLEFDKRGWYSQPNKIYVAPFLNIPVGDYTLSFDNPSGDTRTKNIQVSANSPNVICITDY